MADLMIERASLEAVTEPPLSEPNGEVAGPQRIPAAEPSMRRVEEVMRRLDEDREEVRMDLWDFGGQEVFYIMHHLFLSEFGTYVLTFSMERLAPSSSTEEREKCLAMVRYWLDNIALHTSTAKGRRSAPLVLVGTHKDLVAQPRDHEAISQLLWSNFRAHVQWPFVAALREGVVSTGRGLLWFFPVDNTRSTEQSSCGRDPVLAQLISTVEAKAQAFEHLQRLVPFGWIALFDSMQADLKEGRLLIPMQVGAAETCLVNL